VASRPAGASAGRAARTAPGLASGGRSFPGAPPGDSGHADAGPADSRPAILFLGTSLTAGLGLDLDQAYPALIQQKLDIAGLRWRAVNGGVSGETSAGALRRLEWILEPDVKVLVVETGANDGLRGLDVDSTRANLEAIVRAARARNPGIRIVLAGMEAPPNLGAGYTARFRAVYRDLARRERIPLIPFILAGVGGVDSLNQADGIHPNVAGERIVAANVWRVIETVIREADAKTPRDSNK
jgi:acyl-CoA thioesterase-1